jgi:hypothetical protein
VRAAGKRNRVIGLHGSRISIEDRDGCSGMHSLTIRAGGNDLLSLRNIRTRLLRTCVFEHANSFVAAGDDRGALELPEHERHCRTMYAEHDCKELVLQGEVPRSEAILRL